MAWRRRLSVGLGGALVSALLCFGPVAAQPVLTLADVVTAAEKRDLPTLKRAMADEAFIRSVAAMDPRGAVDLRVSVAQVLADGGDRAGAIAAYQAAIADVTRLDGENAPRLVELLRASSKLKAAVGDTGGAALDLERALTIAKLTLDAAEYAKLKAETDAAWTVASAKPGAPKRPLRFASRAAPEQFDLVEVFYATHRKPTGELIPARFYRGERGPLAFGKAYVSVPRNRATGSVPRPSIWRLEFRPDPEKHVILKEIKASPSREAFFQDLTGRIGASERKEVFVFIHGFNSTFDAAAMRTAQLAADLSVDGAPILYSWPSKSNALAYRADEAEADVPAQVDDLAAFLADVRQKTGAERMHLVGYSLGSRILTNALERLAARPEETRPRFDEVVLASPDLAADDFRRRWPTLRAMAERYTVYASKRDMALLISGQFNGKKRLGDARVLTVVDGAETVDTTAASGGLLGHADFTGNALDDFRGVIWDSLAPSKRCILQADVAENRPYWVFSAGTRDSCSDAEFREVVSAVRRSGSPTRALEALDASLAKPDTDRTMAQSLRRVRDRLIATYGLQPARP